jgi:hypothetical protein
VCVTLGASLTRWREVPVAGRRFDSDRGLHLFRGTHDTYHRSTGEARGRRIPLRLDPLAAYGLWLAFVGSLWGLSEWWSHVDEELTTLRRERDLQALTLAKLEDSGSRMHREVRQWREAAYGMESAPGELEKALAVHVAQVGLARYEDEE